MSTATKAIICEVFAEEKDLFRKSGTGKKSGQPYNMIRQKVYIPLPEIRYPVGFNIVHFEEKDILPAGKYVLDLAGALEVNEYGDLRLGNVKREHLVPMAQIQAKAS